MKRRQRRSGLGRTDNAVNEIERPETSAIVGRYEPNGRREIDGFAA
jgi:hypothetical protein